jgi:hypothetical protein
MGLLGNNSDQLPVHSNPEKTQHRDVLPEGKPRGVAEHNGKTFEEAGVASSDYKEHEYDVEAEFNRAGKMRDEEVYGTHSDGKDEGAKSGGMMDKVMDKLVSYHGFRLLYTTLD